MEFSSVADGARGHNHIGRYNLCQILRAALAVWIEAILQIGETQLNDLHQDIQRLCIGIITGPAEESKDG